MDIELKYRKVFYDLYKSDKGLLAYTLYNRFNIQPTDAIEFIRKYVELGVITIDGEQRICLTPIGRNKIDILLNELVHKGTQCSDYLQVIKLNETIEPFEPYLPDKNFYDKYIKEKR